MRAVASSTRERSGGPGADAEELILAGDALVVDLLEMDAMLRRWWVAKY